MIDAWGAAVRWARTHLILMVFLVAGFALVPSSWGWVPALGMNDEARSNLGGGLVAGALIGWAITDVERRRSEFVAAALERLATDDLVTLATETAMAYARALDELRTQLRARRADGSAPTLQDASGRVWTDNDLMLLRRAIFRVVLGPRRTPLPSASDADRWLVLVDTAQDVLYGARVVHDYRLKSSPQRADDVALAFSSAIAQLGRTADAVAAHGAPQRAARLLELRRMVEKFWRGLNMFDIESDEHMWGRRLTEELFAYLLGVDETHFSWQATHERTDPEGQGRATWRATDMAAFRSFAQRVIEAAAE